MPNRKHEEFFFIGERPSNRAIEMDVTWRDGALQGCDALRCAQAYQSRPDPTTLRESVHLAGTRRGNRHRGRKKGSEGGEAGREAGAHNCRDGTHRAGRFDPRKNSASATQAPGSARIRQTP